MSSPGERAVINTQRYVAWFNFQAPFYHAWRRASVAPIGREVGAIAAALSPRRVLDLACGSGVFTAPLVVACPDAMVVGADMAERMLAIARRDARRVGTAHFVLADATTPPFSAGAFNLVVAAGILPVLNQPDHCLAAVRHLLAEDGTFIVIDFDPDQMRWHTRLLTHLLVAGSRIFTTLMPAYRYAERWNTYDGAGDLHAWSQRLNDAGFTVTDRKRLAGHYLLVAKQSP